ncbi:MAG TPA: zinc-ribbon domain-containing protein [Myxococcaceae bacterium]|nr:zinc-ribbon domain-containing protein [Myxococcaceae bacterium]
MDVRCERCKTEYEFDEDRITEAGVTVRCTHCDHVFVVKKHSGVVTGPVPTGIKGPSAAGDLPRPGSSPTARPRDSAERGREWKVRQPNGNLITFKELTTLQKWIVERKVSRDDEISLTGESWKRLGNIAELSSFFQVVDEARRAARPPEEPSGARAVARGMTPPTGIPRREPGKPPTPPQAVPPVVISLEESIERTPAITEPSAPRASAAPGSMSFETTDAFGVPSGKGDPSFALSATITDLRGESDEALAASAGLIRGSRGRWTIVLFVALLGVVSYLAYRYFVWIPQRQTQERVEAANRESVARAEQEGLEREQAERERLERERAERERAEQERAARTRAPPTKTAEGAADPRPKSQAAAPEDKPEAATPLAKAQPDARTRQSTDTAADPSAPTPLFGSGDGGRSRATARIEDGGNFDTYMSQADRFREREQPRNALDAYAKAAEMEPNRAEPLAGRGLALLDLGRTASAIAAFQQALKLNPREGLALMGLAEAYRAEGNKEEAITYYEKYLEVLPNGPEAAVAKAAIEALQE